MKHLAKVVAVAMAAVTGVAAPAPTAAARHLTELPLASRSLPRLATTRLATTRLATTRLAATRLTDTRLTDTRLAGTQLTDTQLAGQRVIYSYPGLTPPRSLLRAIRRGDAAGVIFFAGNISSPAQLATVAGELQRADASRRNPVRAPLLLMIDQEGGIVRRLPGPPDLSEKQIGQAADPAAQARLAGAGAAATLLSAGLNVNLAPVLDVYRVGRRLHRPVRPLVQPGSGAGGQAGRRLYPRPAGLGRGGGRQALSRPGGGGPGPGHRRAAGDAARPRGYPAPGG